MTTQTESSNKVTGFFKGVMAELKKVNWPNTKQMVKYTQVVIATCAVLTGFIWVIDGFFHAGLQFIIK